MNVRYKLLLAAPEGQGATRLEDLLTLCGYDCITAHTEKQALSLCASHFPDMILVDGRICPRPSTLVDSLRRITDVPLLIITDEVRAQERIAAYQRVMAMVRSMVLQGIISEREYGKIDTIMTKKFGLSSSTIFR